MTFRLVEPATRYDPSPLVDLADAATRGRLAPAGLRFFLQLVAAWQLSETHARALLGGVSRGGWHAIRTDPARRNLSQDDMTRISLLVGIAKALNILHGQTIADRWISLPNTNPIFGGGTPLVFMIEGGIPAMSIVRKLLDARRGGV